MTRTCVLIVEDEPEIAALMRFHLEREGFEARVAPSGRLALAEVEARPGQSKSSSRMPDLVVLDLMLPDLDGLEVCRRLKWQPQTRDIPILIVSAKGDEADIVTGIELGADDYVTKPFSPKVLMARVKNILRRQAHGTPALRAGSLKNREPEDAGNSESPINIDLDRHVVTVHSKPVELTVTEFGILQYLAARPGFVRTRDQIISAVHGGGTVLSSRTIDVHVTALRRKLGEVGSMIQTVRGVGYRLSEVAAVSE